MWKVLLYEKAPYLPSLSWQTSQEFVKKSGFGFTQKGVEHSAGAVCVLYYVLL